MIIIGGILVLYIYIYIYIYIYKTRLVSKDSHHQTKYIGKEVGLRTYRADKSLARPGRKQATATEDFLFSYILFIIIIGGILVLFIYITRLTSNKIFRPSTKIHREVDRAKDLSAPR